MTAPLLIDADSHVTEPADVWTSRVPARHVGDVPAVRPRRRRPRRVGARRRRDLRGGRDRQRPGSPASRPSGPGRSRTSTRAPTTPPRACATSTRPASGPRRSTPTWAGSAASSSASVRDAEVQQLCIRAYNDFLHEWASADPRRLITVCSIPFWDVDASVAEIERCAGLGFRGVLFTGEPQRFGLPTLGDPSWDPPLGRGQRRRVADPLPHRRRRGQHLRPHHAPAAGARPGRRRGVRGDQPVHEERRAVRRPDHLRGARPVPVAALRVRGERHRVDPVRARGAPTTAGSARRARPRDATSDLLPSELFRRQVYATFWFEHVAPTRLLDELPIDNLLFETDFPHVTCLYGNIEETIAGQPRPHDRGGAAQGAVGTRRINAARLYHVEGP